MSKPKGNQKGPGKGGPRPNSGRKKKAATILRELAIKAAHGEAEKSLAFCVQIRDDVSAPKGLRLEAAQKIMDRVWGKSVQAIRPVNADGQDAPFGIIYEPVAQVATDQGDKGL
jgi:hypothetical protein